MIQPIAFVEWIGLDLFFNHRDVRHPLPKERTHHYRNALKRELVFPFLMDSKIAVLLN